MIFVVDNYDSFTFNLVQLLEQLGALVVVRRNDEVDVAGLAAFAPEGVLISPGPGDPEGAGVTLPLIRALGGRVPIFGVCLGHQAIGRAFGGRVVRARAPMHGRTSLIHPRNAASSRGCPRRFRRCVTTRSSWRGKGCLRSSRSPHGRRRARSWASATARSRSKACSFTRSPSSASTGRPCWAVFSERCPPAGRARRSACERRARTRLRTSIFARRVRTFASCAPWRAEGRRMMRAGGVEVRSRREFARPRVAPRARVRGGVA
jgi:hypothetical protein